MKLKKLIFESYLQAINNSVGAKVFRNLYVTDGRNKFDVLQNGAYSCAFFVSAILTLFDLIDRPHATIKSTIQAMIKNGWKKRKIIKPELGDILVWEFMDHHDNDFHEHIGFYIGNHQAISNAPVKSKAPVRHHYQKDYALNKKRAITSIYYWPKFQ